MLSRKYDMSLTLNTYNLSFEYDTAEIFTKLNFSLSSGEIVQICGENGAGKTTFLKLITGIQTPSTGVIQFNGFDIHQNLTKYQNCLSFVGHKPGISMSLTVLENIKYACPPLSHEELEQELLAWRMSHHQNTICNELSAGLKKRVALLVFLLKKKPLWILDEPFSALDDASVHDLVLRLKNHAESGGAVIYTSHQKVAIPRSNIKEFKL